MLPVPIQPGSPWEVIAAVLAGAALVSAAGRIAEAGYIRFGRWSVSRPAMTLLRANSRVWALSTLGLAILGVLALRGMAQMGALWVGAMLVGIGGSILAWHCMSSVRRSGHT